MNEPQAAKSAMTRLRTVQVAVFAVALVVSGCSSAAPTPSSSPSVSASASGAPSGSPGASPSGSPSASPVEGQCLSSGLSASLAGTEGAAGSTAVTIALTNTGSAECTLQGWPGVSLVTGGNGTQLGAAADQDRSSPHETVTLAAGSGHAVFTVQIVNAGNYSDADCGPQIADGLRIYPPGDTGALFAPAAGITGCSVETVKLLMTGAVQPG